MYHSFLQKFGLPVGMVALMLRANNILKSILTTFFILMRATLSRVQNTLITYQGYVTDEGVAFNGTRQFQFKYQAQRISNALIISLPILLCLGQLAPASFGQVTIKLLVSPTDQTDVLGANVTFQVVATSSVPLHYQWVRYRVGFVPENLAGQTNSTLTLTNVQLSDAANYFVNINAANVNVPSPWGVLTVEHAPAFTSTPGDVTVLAGTNVLLSVSTDANPPATYQWRLDGVNIAGATNSALILSNIQSISQGAYTVVASNFIGGITNLPAKLTVIESAPCLSVDLANIVAFANTSVTISASFYGSDPKMVQWHKNGTNIPSATNATFVFSNIQLSDGGTYSLSVTNSLGYFTSRIATVTVENVPLPCSVVAWGTNAPFGQTTLPVGETNVVALAAGETGTVFIRRDGTMGSFGREIVSPGTFARLPSVADVRTDGIYALALGQNGTPVSFGITYLAGSSDVPPTVTNATAVAFGNPRLALLANGTVVGWTPPPGYEALDPLNILGSLAGLSNVSKLAMLNYHCLFLKSNSTVVALGANGSGQSSVPAGLSNVVEVAAGAYHSLVLKRDGTVLAWGDNSRGQTNIPPGLSGVRAISAGDYHNLALQSNGMVVGWGDNSGGQCNIPASLSNVVSISAGGSFSTALTKQPAQAIAPKNQTVYAGTNVTFSFLASGYQPLSYQWQFNGINISGATNATLVITNVPWADAGTYRCVASNDFGAVTGTTAGLTVMRKTPQFSGLSRFTNGGFGMQLKLLSGHGNVILEASSNLLDWLPINTNPPVVGSLWFFDLNVTNAPSRFYRAFEQ